jgi:hypothetical protein
MLNRGRIPRMAESQPGGALTGLSTKFLEEFLQINSTPNHFDGAPSKGFKIGQTLFNSKGWA